MEQQPCIMSLFPDMLSSISSVKLPERITAPSHPSLLQPADRIDRRCRCRAKTTISSLPYPFESTHNSANPSDLQSTSSPFRLMFVFARCFDRSTHIQFCESRHLGKTFDCLVVNLVVAFVIPGILMFSYSKWCSLPRKRTPFEPMLLSAWLVRLLQISRLVSPGRFSTSNLQPPSPILHVPTFLFIY